MASEDDPGPDPTPDPNDPNFVGPRQPSNVPQGNQQPRSGVNINLGGTNPSGSGVNPWAAILGTLGTTILGRYLANRSAENNVPPELRQLLAMSVQRQAFQNPLVEATTRGTYSMLPGFAREGTKLSGGLGNEVPKLQKGDGTDTSGSDNPLTSLNPLRNPLLAGLLGSAANDAMRGQVPFQQAIDALKNLFNRGDRNFTGGPQTYSGNRRPQDPLGGADNPYYYGNVPGYGGDPNSWWRDLASILGVDPNAGFDPYGLNSPTYGNLPGYGMDPNAGYDPYSNLPGYGTPLPDLGGYSPPYGTDWWDE